MVGRVTEATIDRWAAEFDKAGERFAKHFPRVEVKRRAAAFVRTLLSDVERKNGWQTAERLGEDGPSAVQHLLGRSRWNPDLLRDELIDYVRERLGDANGVLVVDETGFIKKGTHSVGVARQYSGAAGRIENCQIGVFLGYASAKGHALIDRELYLPKEWVRDASRRTAAGVPKGIDFATKIALARRMIERAVAAGAPAKWVTADSVYGSDFRFRTTLEALGLGYVVAVRSDFAVWVGFQQVRARHMLGNIPDDVWHRVSCGAGSKGPREFEWALMRTNAPEPERSTRWLLFRRSVTDQSDVAFFACGTPPETTFDELVEVAGKRWTIEECFETAKGDCGLDEYEVRSWTGWHRHVTLAMWAFAVVSVVRSQAISARVRPSRSPSRRRKKGARRWFG
jgi:SRSO17 transposase